MTDDSKILVYKQPLWKKAVFFLLIVLFIILGILLFTNKEYLAGIISLIFGVAGIFKLFKSRVMLIADSEGVIPVFVLRRGSSKKIPWKMIDQISIVTQTIRGFKHKHLAIYLNDPNFLTHELTNTQILSKIDLRIFKKTGVSGLDDGGTAQVYIPMIMLPSLPVEKIVNQLNTMRTASMKTSE